MPEHSIKINLPWTEEHEAYCFQHHIPPAAKLIWQCLMREGEIGTEIEPDLGQINAWVAKVRGRPYAHNYLKKMFNILVDTRVIQVVKQYSWKIFKLLVRPLEWLKPPKKAREKKLHNHNSSYKTEGSNSQSAETGNIQQQHSDSSINQELLSEAGIHFDDNVTEVLERPAWQIKAALILFKIRGGFDKVENPEGFIRDCLRGDWWETWRNHHAIAKRLGRESVAYLTTEELFSE